MKLNDIFLLKFCNKKPIDYKYSNYNLDEYGNIPHKIKTFISSGYIKVGDLRSSVENSTLPVIKEFLKSQNLKTTGKKQDLIDLMFENVDVSIIDNAFPNKYYVLTEKGQKLLEDNKIFFINNQKGYGFSEQEIRLALYKIKGSERDIFWHLLNERLIKSYAENQYSDLAFTHKYMGDILFEEKKYTEALKHYCVFPYIELSGMMASYHVQDFSYLKLAPCNINSINKCLYHSKIDYIEFENIFISAINTFCRHLPFSYFSPEISAKIIVDILNGIDFDPEDCNYPHAKKPKNLSLNNSDYVFDKNNNTGCASALLIIFIPLILLLFQTIWNV